MNTYRRWLSVLPIFFPLYLVRFDLLGIPTTLLEVIVGFTLFYGMVKFVRWERAKKWFKNEWKRGVRSPVWPGILFLIAATISMLIVPQTMVNIDGNLVETGRQAQGIWKGWILLPAVYVAALYVMRDPKKEDAWRPMFTMLTLSGFGLSLWAIYQMVSGNFITMDARASGPFESANYLALYLAPILLYSILSFKRSPFFWSLVSATMLIAFVGAQSYAAFIALFVGLAVYFVFHPKISFKKKLSGALLGAFLVIILFLTQVGTEKFSEFLDFENRTSSSVRIEVYDIALTLLSENPFLGLGLGQFEIHYQLNAERVLGHVPYEWKMLHPHNVLLSFWLNTGILGVIAMAWLLVLAAFSFKKPSPFRLVILSMMVVILTHGLFDTPFFKNDLAYLWWLTLVPLL